MANHAGEFFDFGKGTPEDMQRAFADLESRSGGKLEIDQTMLEGAGKVGQAFLLFVQQVLREMGLLDVATVAVDPIHAVGDVESPAELQRILRQQWNAQADIWAVIESPAAYAITMSTLMEFFRVNERRPYETIVSLGSGAGLYETFLASCLTLVPQARGVNIVCVDSAEAMTRVHKDILRRVRTSTGDRFTSLCPITNDMAQLELPDRTVDQIICINSLQWSLDWKRVIAEMRRVMRPDGLGMLYLFIHSHPMAFVVKSGEQLRQVVIGDIQLSELLDTLEENRFVAVHQRHIGGTPGTGQLGTSLRRVFLLARYQATGEIRPWRDAKLETASSLFSMH